MRRPGSLELFLGFATIALTGFGGVIPVTRRTIVERRAWLSEEEFAKVFALGVFLPGPTVANIGAILGHRFVGWRGAVAAVIGLYLPPLFITLMLTRIYLEYGTLPIIGGAVRGLAATAAGLLVATGMKFLEPYLRRERAWGLAIAVVTFALVGVLRVPLINAVAVVTPFSLAIAWRLRR